MSSVSGNIDRSTSGESSNGAAAGADSREAELFRRARTGDRGAFGQLAIRVQDRLFTAIVRIVGDRDEARELTQETFVKALGGISNFRGESQPFTWLFRIGVNLAISHLRKNQRRRTFSLDAPINGRDRGTQADGLADRLAGASDPPDQRAQQRETQQQVLAALGKLEPEQRAILVMRDMEDMDYQQMADALSVPLGTLKSRLFRARLALRDLLIATMKETGSEKGNGAGKMLDGKKRL